MPALSAERNVEIPLLLTPLGAAERRRKVLAALELVGLSERRTHKPSELSGGQQQRVAIARALIADPTLLICDEPTGDLDRHSADEILGLIQLLNREHGKTVVMVTHDVRAAEYSLHQLHVDKGQLFANGREFRLEILPLIWSGIWRKPGRTMLIFLQVTIAFALFGMLQGLRTGMQIAMANIRADVLYVRAAVRGGAALPRAVSNPCMMSPASEMSSSLTLCRGRTRNRISQSSYWLSTRAQPG